MALFHRGNTGLGQQVEVSALKAMERVAYTAHTLWGCPRQDSETTGERVADSAHGGPPRRSYGRARKGSWPFTCSGARWGP